MFDQLFNGFLNAQVAGNAFWRWLGMCACLLAALIGGRVLRYVMIRTADRIDAHRTRWQSVLLRSTARAVVPLILVAGLRFGIGILLLSPTVAEFFEFVFAAAFTATVGYAVYCMADIVDYGLGVWAAKSSIKIDDMIAPLVGKSIRITILILIAIQMIDALTDKPITTVLAGLGVGGLAIALAGQDTIKNFFGSLVLVADRPFGIGDRVVIDGHDGPVERVGMRSTRVRTLEGALVTIPNGELANKTIQNIGQRKSIRRLSNITITYDTPPEKVQEALQILRDILADHEGMDPELPPRVYFTEFNDASLNLMMIYWYHPPDYWQYMEFCEKVNMEILRRFNEAGIEFAFPTQTLYLAQDEKRQLAIRVLREGV